MQIKKEKVMKTINFINLTNGIEAISDYQLTDYQFIRIQSSICESQNWERLIEQIDTNLLMHLALGDCCIIYDYSANKDIPRALYQGIAFLEFVLERRWFNRNTPMKIRNMTCNDVYYENAYQKIRRNKLIKKKLDYFKKFLNTDNLNIILHAGKTKYDSRYDKYKEMLLKHKEWIEMYGME